MRGKSQPPADELSPSRAEELGLNDTEQEEVKERGRASAIVLHEVIRLEGEQELRRPIAALALSGLAAGLSMGFSLVAEGLLYANLPDAAWRSLVTSLGYTVGFIIVILGRQQLFTENTLTPILPLLQRRNVKTLMRVLRLWTIVLLTNLLGALIFAWVVSHTDIFMPDVRQAFLHFGLKEIEADFWTILLRGVFAGWLIALVAWLLPAVESAAIALIVILTYWIAVAELTHVVAGSVEVLYGVMSGAVTWEKYFGGFMIPTLIGNIMGGIALVAVLNYGQVAPQAKRRS